MNLLEVNDLRVEFSTPDGIVTAVNNLNLLFAYAFRLIIFQQKDSVKT